jgi:hypothetical protein
MPRIRTVDTAQAPTGQRSNAANRNQGLEVRLWQLADALRPKLISGQLRVREAERLVEAAT